MKQKEESQTNHSRVRLSRLGSHSCDHTVNTQECTCRHCIGTPTDRHSRQTAASSQELQCAHT